jgi:16S rRNA (guanine527-N7)-methyltransferase
MRKQAGAKKRLGKSGRREVRASIDALAERHELPGDSAEALREFAQLIDWTEPNFVPKADRGRERRGRRPRETSPRRAVSIIAESLAGLRFEALRRAEQVADIGSGAGFPGLVLATALPHARMTLIEKVPEKCEFLRQTREQLGLENVEVVEGEAQSWSEGVGACDVITSRKVASLDKLAEWSDPLLGPAGAVALWRGRTTFAKEGTSAERAAEDAGLELADRHRVPSTNRKGRRFQKHLYLFRKSRDD